MYENKNLPAAIRTVQGYLYELHRAMPNQYLRVYTDGVYSYETRAAVENFQNTFSLPITGEVDFETFDTLYSEYLAVTTAKKGEQLGFPVGIGDMGRIVEQLHLWLRELRCYYTDIPTVKRSQYYSEETRDAVDYMREVFGMDRTGEVNLFFYERLEKEIDARKRVAL